MLTLWISVWFWMYKCSEYTRVLNEYVWIIPRYIWFCLKIFEYDGKCENMPKSAWMGFVLHFPFVIPCLPEHVVTHISRCAKLEVTVWRNIRLFSWRDKIWFFLERSNTSSNSLVARLLVVVLVVLAVLLSS